MLADISRGDLYIIHRLCVQIIIKNIVLIKFIQIFCLLFDIIKCRIDYSCCDLELYEIYLQYHMTLF